MKIRTRSKVFLEIAVALDRLIVKSLNVISFKIKLVLFSLSTVSRTVAETVVNIKLKAWNLNSLVFLRVTHVNIFSV
jgi:hypothetical protein